MNKILEKVPGTVRGFKNVNILNSCLWNCMVDDLAENNTFCPDIVRIIYNVGSKNDRKTLTTVVFFSDGTKVAVTNSEHDGIQFEEAVREVEKIGEDGKKYIVKEGRGFEIATKASKEAGLVYAIVKRMIGLPDQKGNIQGCGFGRILNEFVDEAYDSVVEKKNRKEANAAAKAKYEASKGTGKQKTKRLSLAQTVDRMTEILNKLDTKLA